MGLVGAPDRLRAGLAQAEVAHLALLDQPRHGADRFLDRHALVDAVDVIEVDHVDAEPLQARLAGDRHVVRLAVDAAALAVRAAHVAELRRDDHLVALALDALADQLLVLAGAVGVGRVEQVEAELDGAVHGLDQFDVVRHAVVAAHAGAAEPDGRNDEALRAEFSLLHHLSCLSEILHAVSHRGDRFDLQEKIRIGQPAQDAERAAGRMLAEIGLQDAARLRHVVRVADVDRDLGDVRDFRAAAASALVRFCITILAWASKSSGGSTLPSTSAATWPAANTSFCAPSPSPRGSSWRTAWKCCSD